MDDISNSTSVIERLAIMVSLFSIEAECSHGLCYVNSDRLRGIFGVFSTPSCVDSLLGDSSFVSEIRKSMIDENNGEILGR